MVVILPDTGRNYPTKFYDDDWLVARGLVGEPEASAGPRFVA